MTIQDIYNAVLIELNKVKAPALLLQDFVYFYNKAVQQYINTRYNLFEANQQLTDDLRVLSDTKKLPIYPNMTNSFGSNYSCILPDNYLHILNCICEFVDLRPNRKCPDDEASTFQVGANKIDTSQWGHVNESYYMKPSYKRPYYYIVNIEEPKAGDPTTIGVKMTDRESGKRYGNATQPIMQIKCGKDPRYKLQCVYVTYLQAPQFISIDETDLDKLKDESTPVEYPDYVVYEIINILTRLVLENASDPRMQTQPAFNTTVGPGGAN